MTLASLWNYMNSEVAESLLPATAICTAGLVSNNPSAVVASMLVNPLGGQLRSIVSTTLTELEMFGFFKNKKFSMIDFWKILAPIKAHVIGVLVALGTGMLGGLVVDPDDLDTDEIKNRYNWAENWRVTLIFAVSASWVLAYQIARKDGADMGAAIGFGIAIALLPPIVTSGILVGKYIKTGDKDDMRYAGQSFGLYTLNTGAIVVITTIVTLLLNREVPIDLNNRFDSRDI